MLAMKENIGIGRCLTSGYRGDLHRQENEQAMCLDRAIVGQARRAVSATHWHYMAISGEPNGDALSHFSDESNLVNMH